jgi:hypothetical protein
MNIKEFIDNLDRKVQIQNAIYAIFQIYNKNDPEYLKLIEVVEYYYPQKIRWVEKYELILDKIMNDITDFQINLSDGQSIKCSKNIIKRFIPYLSLFYGGDFNNINEIFLDTDPELTKLLVKLLYTHDYSLITIDNFVNLCKLMDMFLMDSAFVLCMNFAAQASYSNFKIIINNELTQNYIDNIVQLHKIFERLKNKSSTYTNICNGICNTISNTFYQKNQNIFVFDNWPKIFSPMGKLAAIRKYQKYELLNVVDLAPKDIIPFLMDVFYENTFYYDIANHLKSSGNNIKYMSKGDKYTFQDGSNSWTFIITNYFPIFSYIKLIHIPSCSYQAGTNIINIMNNFNRKGIKIGTKIILANTTISMDENSQIIINEYTITNIIAYYDNHVINIKKIKHILSDVKKIKYELILDKNIQTNSKGGFWMVKHKMYESKHNII